MLCYPKIQSMSRNLFSFFLILSSLHLAICETGTLGINYGRIANNLPSPTQVVQLLKAQGITKVKLYDTDSTVLSAFSASNVSLTVTLPNEQLSSAAASQSYTDTWVQSNILSYYPKTQIEAIAVGNEVFVNSQNTPFLVPAMKNVYASLTKYDVASSIKVVSPIALSALQTSYPPSSGSFKSDLIEPVIKPMLNLLKQTGSSLMANVYPFFAYESDPKSISLDYALFQANSGNPDPNNNNLVYNSLFEAQIDAVYAAMNAIGFNDLKLVVSETGWPSKGGDGETGAGVENAAAYNGNLVRRVLTGSGTPLRPNDPLDVYLFALFNENQKTGATSENNYGLFYPNEQKVYDIPLTVEDLKNGMSNGSKSQVAAAPNANGGGGNGQTWCVASDQVGEEKLQEALDYACGEGGADCRPIQPGSTCYDPSTLVAHASYAFNSYYQRHSRESGTCYFGGAAYVVTQNPNFGSCEYPTGN